MTGDIIGDFIKFSNYSVITLTYDKVTFEITPLINGKPVIDCPDDYRVKTVGFYDEKLHYRCLLIQEKTDCLDTEFYSRYARSCIPTFSDPEGGEICGDRYFLDSICHDKYVPQQIKVSVSEN